MDDAWPPGIDRAHGHRRPLAVRHATKAALRGLTRRRLAMALLVVLVAIMLTLHVALDSGPRTIPLSGPVAGGPMAPIGLDTRTRRAFIVTGGAMPGQFPPRGTSSYLDVLDTTHGTLVRSVALGPAPFGLVIDEQTTRAFVADLADGTVRMFDARSGGLLRTLSFSPLAANDIAIDPLTNRVFVASTLYNTVLTLDARSGALLRTVRNAGDVLTVDSQTGRVFAFISNNGSTTNPVGVLDARSGALLRTVTVSQAPLQITVLPVTGQVAMTGSTALLLLDGRTGRVQRTLPVPVSYMPQIAGETVNRLLIAGLGPGIRGGQYLSLLDRRTGHIVRTLLFGPGESQAILDAQHGHVIAVGESPSSGRLWLLDARSGATIQTATIAANPVAIAVVTRTQRILIASEGAANQNGVPVGPGSLTVLDAMSGRVLRTISLDPGPDALLVDEATGHVFVIVGDGVTQTFDAWGRIASAIRQLVPFLHQPRSSFRTIPSSIRMLTTLP